MIYTIIRSQLFIILCIFSFTHIQSHSTPAQSDVHYPLIKKLLDQYKRPITVLELDPGTQSYSFKIATEYNACCVITEANKTDTLLEQCTKIAPSKSLMLLQHDMSLSNLETLAQCEHFDVVLALSRDGITKYQEDWRQALEAYCNLGDHLFILVNSSLEHDARSQVPISVQIKNFLIAYNATPLMHTETDHKNTELFLLDKPKKQLIRKYWTFKRLSSRDDFIITSDFTTKTLYKKKGSKILPWLPGINLLTFKKLNGIFPTNKIIRDLLAPFKHIKHTDLHIWNVIIQGKTLIPIDGDDRSLHFKPKYTLQSIIAQFKRYLLGSFKFKFFDSNQTHA